MPVDHERRRFWRAVFHAPASIASEGRHHHVDVIDLSLKGALVEFPVLGVASRGQSAELSLPLADDARIAMQMRVVHVEGKRVGLRCEHIDLDSITHLRKLVEMNCGDSAQLERELANLCA
ncbi:MAG: PilZ domain-containing protein [Rhodocyclaceae bacterium]|nr:PilZ domain-containing protein [Rhodocyclaceae bacterium]